MKTLQALHLAGLVAASFVFVQCTPLKKDGSAAGATANGGSTAGASSTGGSTTGTGSTGSSSTGTGSTGGSSTGTSSTGGSSTGTSSTGSSTGTSSTGGSTGTSSTGGSTAAATPVPSVPGGAYASDQSLTLSTSSSGATIYYTLDNSPPTTSSTPYTAAITIAGNGANVTINAIANGGGFSTSSIFSATYTITYPTAVAPTLSPNLSVIDPDQAITLSTPTAGASIFYTTNGDTPTDASTPYAGPFTLAAAATVKAIAGGAGLTDSGITSFTFDCVATLSFVATSGDDTPTTSSASTPFQTIERAVALASSSCADHIRVAAGTYCIGGSVNAGCPVVGEIINLPDHVAILGGYDGAGTSWSRAPAVNVTTIVDNGVSGTTLTPILIGAAATNATIVDGFTIVGQTNATADANVYSVFSAGGSPSISNNTLTASFDLAGIAGAYYAIYSAGGSPLIVANQIVAANVGSAFGLYLVSGGAPLVFSNTIDTTAAATGAYPLGFNFSVVLDGGAAIVSNNTIAFGDGGTEAGGVGTYANASSSDTTAAIENNIIWSAGVGTTRCITAQYTNQAPASLKNNDLFACTLLYSDVHGDNTQTTSDGVNALSFAANNLSFDLLGGDTYFVADLNDWHLHSGDPAADTDLVFATVKSGGLNGGTAKATYGVDTDRDGATRPASGGWSMGAYQQNH